MAASKIVTAAQAVSLVKAGDTIATAGFVGVGFPELLATALEQRFKTENAPRDLCLVYAAGQGDGHHRGLNHLAHEGLIKRVIGGHWGLVPGLGKLARENKIEAYNLPQGVICHLFRDIAAGRPGSITHIGKHTFVDPRLDGGRLNDVTTEPIVDLIKINEEEFLFYKSFPIQVAFLRGTTADPQGNISMEREALPLESLAIAQAVRNSGGKVIVQVERLTQQHQLPASMIKIPAIMVDQIVVAPSELHWQTFAEAYNPSYTGEVKADPVLPPAPLDQRKLIARRALMELKSNATINLGIGMPEALAAVASEEKMLNDVTITIEPGGIGGLPASGLSFGAVVNPEAIVDQPAQFDFYDGGGLDQAFLGMAQVNRSGDVNVSRFGNRIAGAGGFINISQSAREIYFMGTFLCGKQQVAINSDKSALEIPKPEQLDADKQTTIDTEASHKFVDEIEHLTFSGQYALECGQKVYYITERCVFRLTASGLELIEIAPGINLENDILRRMDFSPKIANSLCLSDHRIYRPGPMNLKHPGSTGIHHLRKAFLQAQRELVSG
ncbi:acyl CoA:acetate/3-ketoacid CoA transferase [Motiliproteus sp. MSK22-1]|uniref:acyl CoA:acetate/3-ketoacid CoA transferase n=1 Tax=Motiliproteus sp. MSK22-1 TaxID=1897630 RepID=UPI00097711AD|nr:CoA-transferase [Motiliproteus sp. MSK22-1]OMH32619.1 acyl CoA:acetate/3-ketoacid CoA transferase [Motiliproteus sp. MSK22-1]